MKYRYIHPSPDLAPFIRYYWMMEIDSGTFTPEKQRVFSYACPELTFYYRDPFSLINGNETRDTQAPAVLSGQKTTFTDLIPTGHVGILSVVFRPQAVRLFFKIPSNHLTDLQVLLTDIDTGAGELTEALALSHNTEDRIALIETYLRRRIAENLVYDFKRIGAGIALADHRFAMVTVDQMAGKACLSPRQFERRFLEFTGLTPKKYLRAVRFQNSLYQKQLDPSLNLTQLAHAAGYYDQPHFTNEFKAFTGMHPRQYFSANEAWSDYFSLH